LLLKEFKNRSYFLQSPDTMYMHKAMRAPDAEQFKEAMKKEVAGHTEKGHWRVISKTEVPNHAKILPAQEKEETN
jgi:hypothetical protein